MHIPITIAVLALLTVAMVLLGICWMRVHPRLRFFLIRVSIVMIVLHAFYAVTKWGTTSIYLNVVINWLAIAGYELLVVLFSRLSPRWLTSLCAAVLIAPLFAASIMLPLTYIFEPGDIKEEPIGNHLYYRAARWNIGGTANSGVDLDIFYSPPFAPFLSRRVQSQPFNSDECDAFRAFVLPGPTPGTVIARCPHRPGQPEDVDKLLQLH
jgi:hypothetical protein